MHKREDANNILLRTFSIVGVLLGITGIWLLFYSFQGNRPEDGAE